jgi:Short C-terminal domain
VPFMRRRPLLRAAAVGGGAYMAGKHRERSQQREADQDARLDDIESQPAAAAPAAAAPAPSGGLSADAMEQLKSLAQLHDQGILTDQEFDQQKAKILGG